VTDIDSLIEQAAREIQVAVTSAPVHADDPLSPRVVTITRKDGSKVEIQIPATAGYTLVFLLINSQAKSAVSAERVTDAKQAKIDELEAQLKALKGE
jgi:hypothetical protein